MYTGAMPTVAPLVLSRKRTGSCAISALLQRTERGALLTLGVYASLWRVAKFAARLERPHLA